DAIASNGALGSGASEIESVQPFSIEPKLPLQVTSGDVIQLPIGIVNGTRGELRSVQISTNVEHGIQFTTLGDNGSVLGPKDRGRRFVQLDISPEFSGAAKITLDAKAGPYRDNVGRMLDVQPLGFPHESTVGGVLDTNGAK